VVGPASGVADDEGALEDDAGAREEDWPEDTPTEDETPALVEEAPARDDDPTDEDTAASDVLDPASLVATLLLLLLLEMPGSPASGMSASRGPQ
jgi:hypothetical protein